MSDPATKVAIVTGAGSGVGRDTATLLSEDGYAVILVGRHQETLQATADFIDQEVEPLHPAQPFPTDITDEAQVEKLIAHVEQTLGRLDAIANVAGVAPLQPLFKIERDAMDHCLQVNLYGPVFLTKHAWKLFRRQKQGVVVNVSSMAAFDPFTGFNIYAAAKAGVNLFTKATADEGSRLGVRAAAVAPGAIETQMLRDNFSTKAIPETNTLDPMKVAGVIRDLITGERKHQPGEIIQLPSPH